MPIPTRSQSVRTASKAPSKSWQHEEARKTAHSNAMADPRAQSRSSALPQPQLQPPVVSHKRSHSTTVQSMQGTHQRPGSISGPPLQNRTQTTSFSLVSSSGESKPRSLRPPQGTGLPKPAFSTYQQHFSPQKSQPHPRQQQTKVAAFEHSSSDPGEGQYISRLQDELLQLSLVHQHSTRTLQAFERDVNEKLALAAHKLQKEREVVSTLETEFQKDVNALALFNWLRDENTNSRERKVRDLSFCIKELATLSGDGGLFDQLMLEFVQWLENAQKVMPMLTKDAMDLDDDDDSICALDPPRASWRYGIDECSTRLDLCQQLLKDLGGAEPDTGIGIVLGQHRQLAAVMLNKLHTAQDIVNAVTASQQQFASRTLTAALNEVTVEDGNDERKGIWSVLEHGCIKE